MSLSVTGADGEWARAAREKPRVSDHLRQRFGEHVFAQLNSSGAMTFSGLRDFWSPQQLLADRMIIIVTHFGAWVVEIILAGRNSGQKPTYAGRKSCYRHPCHPPRAE